MPTTYSNRQVFLALSLVLLGFFLMACGSQEAPKEAAKDKATPAAAPPAAPTGGATAAKTADDYIKQGKEALAAKQFDQAIAAFGEAIKVNPQLPLAYNNRGIAHCNKNELDQAISDFSKVIELDPKYGKAYNNRAVAYFMKGDLDKARQDVTKAQELGIPVNQMLIDRLNPPAPQTLEHGKGPLMLAPAPGAPPAPSAAAPGISPAPVKPETPSKPAAEDKGAGKKK